MPSLLNVLRNANGADYRKLRVKAMECAGLIGTSLLGGCVACGLPSCAAIAVGRDVFCPDTSRAFDANTKCFFKSFEFYD